DEHAHRSNRPGAARALACAPALHHARILSASFDPGAALGFHLYGLGSDGPVRTRIAWARRLHGHWRLCAGAVVELSGTDAVDRHSPRRSAGGAAGTGHWLSVLQAQGGRALFRAGDAGAGT